MPKGKQKKNSIIDSHINVWKKAHELFDPLWQADLAIMSRQKAYVLLTSLCPDFPKDDIVGSGKIINGTTHFALLSKNQCNEAMTKLLMLCNGLNYKDAQQQVMSSQGPPRLNIAGKNYKNLVALIPKLPIREKKVSPVSTGNYYNLLFSQTEKEAIEKLETAAEKAIKEHFDKFWDKFLASAKAKDQSWSNKDYKLLQYIAQSYNKYKLPSDEKKQYVKTGYMRAITNAYGTYTSYILDHKKADVIPPLAVKSPSTGAASTSQASRPIAAKMKGKQRRNDVPQYAVAFENAHNKLNNIILNGQIQQLPEISAYLKVCTQELSQAEDISDLSTVIPFMQILLGFMSVLAFKSAIGSEFKVVNRIDYFDQELSTIFEHIARCNKKDQFKGSLLIPLMVSAVLDQTIVSDYIKHINKLDSTNRATHKTQTNKKTKSHHILLRENLIYNANDYNVLSAAMVFNPDCIGLILKEAKKAGCLDKLGLTESSQTRKLPLHLACLLERIDFVEALLKHGANLDVKGENGCTALYTACEGKRPAIAKMLREKGANPNIANDNKTTPLIIAVQNELLDTVKYLVNNGADVSRSNYHRTTALLIAAEVGNVPITEFLLEQSGININHQNDEGATALCMASQYGHIKIVTMLQLKGADGNITTKQNMTAFSNSYFHNGFNEITKMLLKDEKTDVNKPMIVNGKHLTPLELAFKNFSTDAILGILLHPTTNPDQRISNGKKQMDLIEFAEMLELNPVVEHLKRKKDKTGGDQSKLWKLSLEKSTPSKSAGRG